jgi:hypothetical protein
MTNGMTFSAKINIIKQPKGSTLAFATLIINDVVMVDGFKVMGSERGEWVARPSERSNKVDENGKAQYFDRVRFQEERPEGSFNGPVQEAAAAAILNEYARVRAYGNANSGPSKAGNQAARANNAAVARPQPSGARPNEGGRGPVGW